METAPKVDLKTMINGELKKGKSFSSIVPRLIDYNSPEDDEGKEHVVFLSLLEELVKAVLPYIPSSETTEAFKKTMSQK